MKKKTESMLTWRWVRTGGNRFGRAVIPKAAVSVMRESAFGGYHRGSDPSSVVRRGRRQIRDPGLRVRMMMASRVDRMVMPSRGVRRVVAPALGEALMTGRNGRIRGTRSRRGRASPGRGAGGGDTGRVIGLVVGSGAGGGGGTRCRRGWRPEAERAGFPVVPGGSGSGGRVGRQIVIGRGIVTPVGLVMIEGVSRGCGRRVVRVLGMMGTVTPTSLGASRGRMGMTNDTRWSSGGRGVGLDAADFAVRGSGWCGGQSLGGYMERAWRAVARHRGGARRRRAGAGCGRRRRARSRGSRCSW